MRRVREVHVFDFDGTLFRSPTPHPTRVDIKYGEGTLNRLLQPVTAGGLGWFQHRATLSPPYVPTSAVLNLQHSPVIQRNDNEQQHGGSDAAAAAAVVAATTQTNQDTKDEVKFPSLQPPLAAVVAPTQHFREDGSPLPTLFVEPICRQFIKLSALMPRPAAAAVAAQQQPPPTVTNVMTYVMTGRDNSYRRRVSDILASASMAPSGGLFLKPNASSGTVKYKVCSFLKIAHNHGPERIVYYEDRAEQGEKIEAGVRFVQWMLFLAVANARLMLSTQPPQQQQQPQYPFPAARHYLMSLPLDNDALMAQTLLNAVSSSSTNHMPGNTTAITAQVLRMLELVPEFHRSIYRDEIFQLGILHRLLVEATTAPGNLPHSEEIPKAADFVAGVDGGVVAEPSMPPPAAIEASPLFAFRIHYVSREDHPDSYLDEVLEEKLLKELEDSALEAANNNGLREHGHYYRGGRGGGYHHYQRGGGRGRGGYRGRGNASHYSNHHNYGNNHHRGDGNYYGAAAGGSNNNSSGHHGSNDGSFASSRQNSRDN